MEDLVIGEKKLCCQVEENLVIETKKPDKATRRCKVCKARHYEMIADVGQLKFLGNSVGERK